MPQIESSDLETIAQILESEHASHCRKRSMCLLMFVIFFGVLLLALTLIGLHVAGLMFERDGAAELGGDLWVLQVLAPLAAAVVSFFTAWWATQNCINSIERTLLVARANKHHLFVRFLDEVQCADKKKRRLLLDLLKGVVT